MARHLTFTEREVLYRMRKSGKTPDEIAEALGRHRSTVYRELDRNSGERGYRPKQAQRQADERREHCRRKTRMSQLKLKNYVIKALAKKWSPDEIAGRLRIDFARSLEMRISHQTIYNWLSTDEGNQYRVCLRRGHRRSKPETRGQLPHCNRIQGRPKIVDSKRRYGDWEGDTVVSPGRRSGLVTVVDRKSKFLRVRKTSSLKSEATINAACRAMRDLPEELRRTMTLDNGKEFARHEILTDKLGLDVYFADPYASWQRGLNENTNGLLRQFFPKGTDFSQVSHQQVAAAEKLINQRPRKSLQYRTPSEIINKENCRN